ncbi:hypothetical protein ACFRR7_33210 [Streptomyces sp. NPDC056909]|uniref:hypothetical protein n=1 Tax=Streptomyces sp. NPDC056909 TaxID=3345963 RepID=UPI0036C0C35B
MIEFGESELFISTLGRFATGDEDDFTARRALELAGFRWIDGTTGAIRVRQLSEASPAVAGAPREREASRQCGGFSSRSQITRSSGRPVRAYRPCTARTLQVTVGANSDLVEELASEILQADPVRAHESAQPLGINPERQLTPHPEPVSTVLPRRLFLKGTQLGTRHVQAVHPLPHPLLDQGVLVHVIHGIGLCRFSGGQLLVLLD